MVRKAVLAGVAVGVLAALVAAPVVGQDSGAGQDPGARQDRGAGQDRSGVNLGLAGSGARGGVAMLVQARDLYGLGLAQKDALTVLVAARLVGAVGLRGVVQKKTPAGADAAQAVGLAPVAQAVAMAPDAAAMLAAARELAGEDETVVGLIEAAEAEAAFGQTGEARATPSVLAAGAVETWEIPLFGGSSAELAVLGDGGGNLDVVVTDENGNTVCLDVGGSDRVYCDFTPAWNGYFAVRVENLGGGENSYVLLTN